MVKCLGVSERFLSLSTDHVNFIWLKGSLDSVEGMTAFAEATTLDALFTSAKVLVGRHCVSGSICRDSRMPMALADYPLTSEEKSKRKEEIDIINIRYSAVDKFDGISIFARCKLLDLTHLFS
ncbi:hypothetical protein H5410_008554 [Solanum commersonii]|uniref:Uncharacterized protein n=1 Tax=Solanum commersonii TaxID=4109 RepID=A0A9J6AFH9_SOLCO|nr:hypothetical protein H5410_008554 [Solanum commersonii]